MLLASKKGDFEQLKFLHHEVVRLNKPYDINYTGFSKRGKAAIHCAAKYGHIDVSKYLINDMNANINLQDKRHGSTCLHGASYHGHYDCVKFLLSQKNIDTTIENKYNCTAEQESKNDLIKQLFADFKKSTHSAIINVTASYTAGTNTEKTQHMGDNYNYPHNNIDDSKLGDVDVLQAKEAEMNDLFNSIELMLAKKKKQLIDELRSNDHDGTNSNKVPTCSLVFDYLLLNLLSVYQTRLLSMLVIIQLMHMIKKTNDKSGNVKPCCVEFDVSKNIIENTKIMNKLHDFCNNSKDLNNNVQDEMKLAISFQICAKVPFDSKSNTHVDCNYDESKQIQNDSDQYMWCLWSKPYWFQFGATETRKWFLQRMMFNKQKIRTGEAKTGSVAYQWAQDEDMDMKDIPYRFVHYLSPNVTQKQEIRETLNRRFGEREFWSLDENLVCDRYTAMEFKSRRSTD